ncbi:MAG: hypothetical protein EHM33_05985 [Chloroflexi bacterium]|nr:MAG: hypothetical protein EHM33_05985 [Chloroflexota bacterium]
MARADTPTWLPLDEFATIIGLNPLNFNGLYSSLFPNNVCGDVFFQYDYQHSDRIGRDTIARAVREAELEMAAEAGFNLMPDWTTEERLPYPVPAMPGAYNMTGANPRGMLNSVELRKGLVISGGVRAKSLIFGSAPVVMTDVDGDGYAETCTVTEPTSVTDANEIHIFYPGKDGEDIWEIRPIKVSLTGGNAVITFKSWQIVDESKLEELDVQPLDAASAASYETAVDIYRVYNDPATQLQFMWENTWNSNCCGSCSACQFSTQAGCFHLRDHRLGFIVPAPATWSAADSEFTTQEWTACRAPDQIRVWYLSGWQGQSLARPKATLDPYWKNAIAYFAASKFDRPICGCSNVSQFIDKWRRDAAFTSQEEGAWTMTPEQAGNKMGTSMGALYAYRTIHRNGVRIIK